MVTFSPRRRISLWGHLAAALAVTAALSATSAAAAEPLVWAVLDFPPFQILDGSRQGTGSFDGLLGQLTDHLRDYDHHVVPMSFARRDEEMRSGKHFCTPGIFRTQARIRQGWVFSLPALIHLDNRVVMLADTAERLGITGAIDLETLLARQDVVGGLVAGRSYAPNIDAAIERRHGAANLMVRAIRAEQFFQMLLARQVDYLILFPHEAAFFAQRFDAADWVVDRPILGTPPYIFTHVACVGEGWATGMVARIDATLRAIRPDPGYRALSESWYRPEDRALVAHYFPEMLRKD